MQIFKGVFQEEIFFLLDCQHDFHSNLYPVGVRLPDKDRNTFLTLTVTLLALGGAGMAQ